MGQTKKARSKQAGGSGGNSSRHKSPTFKTPKPITRSLYTVPMQSPKKKLYR